MPQFMEMFGFVMRSTRRKAVTSASAFALMAWSGTAGAVDVDKLRPVKLAANAPGMIRTETCARPAYPEQESRKSLQGLVTLRLQLGTDGKVKQSLLAKSSGFPTLDEATLVAISKCSFNPPMVDGKPVEAWIHFQYDWK